MAQQVETERNRRNQFIDRDIFPVSYWSDRANELAQMSARPNRAVQSKRMSERRKQTREQSMWPHTLRIDFMATFPIVHVRHKRIIPTLDYLIAVVKSDTG